MTPIIPDPEHVSWIVKLWQEIKSTPPDIFVGIATSAAILAKIFGRSVRQKEVSDPAVKKSQMDKCKKDIIDHVDKRFNHLEERIDNHLETQRRT
jgi:hypothetical protein